MKITHAKLGQLGLQNSRGNRLLLIRELAGPKEFNHHGHRYKQRIGSGGLRVRDRTS